ncbi:MAG: hypothetical protein HWN80_00010 [Candidatus Lokiarchaeota archaeon]|nr:hypothetical protein [Candidatus Lokiarchaeota archaeon]
MHSNQAIFKIGGKVLENPNNLESTISQLTQLKRDGTLEKIIIIPGGGSYANFIRLLEREIKLGGDLAHWMAVYSMNFNGIKLGGKYPELECIEDFKKLQQVNKKFCIFLPLNFLRDNDALPHSWDVTSDSIAFYIACKLQLNYCFLIKGVDGLFNIDGELIKEITTQHYNELKKSRMLAEFGDDLNSFKKSKPIDSYLLTLIDKYKIPCYLINGSLDSKRIIEFFNYKTPDEKKIYTKIVY